MKEAMMMNTINRNKPISKAIILLIVCCTLSACHQKRNTGTAVPKTVAFKAKELLVIGKSENPDELFTRPRILRLDSKGNFYVADWTTAEIQVFDAEGKFLKKIGGRGEGPGEFQQIRAMDVVGDKIIVFDAQNKAVTIFDLEGKVLQTTKNNAITFETFQHIDTSNLLSVNRIEADSSDYSILSKYDFGDNFRNLEDGLYTSINLLSYSDIEEIKAVEQNEFIRGYYMISPTHLSIISSNVYYYTPSIYRGEVYKITLIPEKNSPQIERLKGYSGMEKPITILSEGKDTRPKYFFSTGDKFAIIHSKGYGIFRYQANQKDHLLNFSFENTDGNSSSKTAIEIFENDKLIGRGYLDKIISLDGTQLENLVLRPQAIQGNKLFALDFTEGIPLVKVVELTYELE